MAESKFFKNVLSYFSGEARQGKPERPALPHLEQGTKLTIVTALQSAPDEEILLTTPFEHLEENGLLVASAPIYKGGFLALPVGETCSVTYAVGNNTYSFACCVNGYTTEVRDDIEFRFIVLERVTAVNVIERRDNFRLPTTLPCEIKRGGGDEESETALDGRIVDISGGGAQVILSALLEEGEVVVCSVMLGNRGRKELPSTVRWIAQLPYAHAGTYKAGLSFNDLPESETDDIIKYIFKEQLRRRQISMA